MMEPEPIEFGMYRIAYRLGYQDREVGEFLAFVEMCRARKLDPLVEARKAIQARYDAMLAE